MSEKMPWEDYTPPAKTTASSATEKMPWEDFTSAATNPAAPTYTKGQAATAGAVMGATAGTALPVAAYATSRAPMETQYDPMGNVISATPIDNSGPSYEEQGTKLRQQLTDIRQQQPGAYLAGNVAGAVLSPVNKVGGLVKGTSALASVGRGTLTGATYGGISGGAETGTPEGALTGTITGAVGGGTIAGVVRGVQNTADAIATSGIVTKLKDALSLPKQQAASFIQKYFPELQHLDPTKKGDLKEILDQGAAYTSAIQKDPNLAARWGLFEGDLNPTWGQALRQTAGQSLTGAGVGAAGALYSGQDPVKGALTGALAGPLIVGGGGAAFGRGSNLAPLAQKMAIPLSKGQWLAPNADSAYGSFASTVGAAGRGVQNAITTNIAPPQTLKEANAQLFDLFK